MKNKIIAGNWKMNKTGKEAEEFVKELIPLIKGAGNTVILCTPFTCLEAVAAAAAGTGIFTGAQNVHWEKSGAFTGEVSAPMLAALGVRYAIVGHSERRQYFGETDATVNKRARAALSCGIRPIICVGETLDERESGRTCEVLERQLEKGFEGFTAEQAAEIIIAYEPVWAIGTGRTAAVKDASDTIGFIRGVISEMFGESAGENIYILYGGSMNEKNAGDLLAAPGIDGGLIGGASLEASKFAAIVKG